MDRELTTNLLDCLCAKVRNTPLNSDQAAERSALVSDLGYLVAGFSFPSNGNRPPSRLLEARPEAERQFVPAPDILLPISAFIFPPVVDSPIGLNLRTDTK